MAHLPYRPMLQEYKIQDGESVFDVVLKLYGSLELYGQYMQDNIDNFTDDYYQSITYYNGTVEGSDIIALAGDYSEVLLSGQFVVLSTNTSQQIEIVDSYYTGFPPGETIVTLNTTSLISGPVSIGFAYNNEQLQQGAIALYDPSLYVSSPPELTRSAVIPSTIKTLEGQEGQSIYDICMMAYGDIGEVYRLLQDSGIDSINETNLANTVFTYDTTFIADSTFYNYISYEGIIINTGEGPDATIYLSQQNYYLVLQENGYRIIIP